MDHRFACSSVAIAVVACLLAAPLSGCDNRQVSGPPTAPVGTAVCAACDMTVREDRYAAGAVVIDKEVRTHLSFDDIGCLLDHERDHKELRYVEWYVRDASSGEWLDATRASFVLSDMIQTPMASGIAAHATRDAAQAQAVKVNAAVQTLDEIRASRQKWMEDRYGKPGG
jgi:copper chaperone NosL